ncbi:Protein N-acetyltransferase, RimJ/RimL family [Nocardia amikacinitolerans]|uniref:GNAT family N-acetyltransferase n=1 Tax=Nocardia amikacinitolerans TaxID=756689 RepID=UPI0020A4BB11|nr:GNAT family N-acetyltransferase [Nocardia amikacinitolerans]MCP2298367.1 Protein N-acetyltransferase, RimJ/RimL family [Nocardia amikacinitolerans]
MQLPAVVLTAYETKDKTALELWWEDKTVVDYLGALEKQLKEWWDKTEADPVRNPGRRVAGPLLRWMAIDPNTGNPVGFVCVQVTGQGGPEGKASPVGPPFHGGVNIVVDPQERRGGFGTAIVRALFEQPALADVETLGGAVDATNTGSLGMLRKLGVTEYTERVSGGKVFRDFVISRPSAQ